MVSPAGIVNERKLLVSVAWVHELREDGGFFEVPH